MSEQQKISKEQGPMAKVLGYIGFGIGMVLMFAFIPVSENAGINAVVGAIVGIVSGGIGSFIGSLMDKSRIERE